MAQENDMKNIWMLSMLLAFAGCQPDVQENPVAPPAPAPKSEAQTETKQVVAAPAPQKEPTKIMAAPQSAKPVQPQPAPEKTASKAEAVVAPPVMEAVPASTPAKTEAPAAVEPTPVAATAPQAQLSEAEAMALAKKKNCFACHALDKKVVGPAWRAVAEKYRGDAGAQAVLESKVRKGGKGNWGSIAMPPQPALSDGELTGLVRFVLQLK
ncbi:MAG: c-type cytochrome [Sideroxydans sp.]|nr:c-type cytochrome [Sideroxydans sp.]